MKILHTADWHADYNYPEFEKQVNFIIDYIKKNNIDLVLHAGDLFNGRIYADKLYNKIIGKVQEIADLCDFMIVYGTPSHDYRGSLDSLEQLKTENRITVFDKLYEPMLFTDTIDRVIIVPLPWPAKYRLLDNEELKLPILEQNKLYDVKFKKWLKDKREKYNNKKYPVILLAHLQLIGAIPSKHQDINSENHNPTWFYDICDYGALGHIHDFMGFVNTINRNDAKLYYSGSIYNKTWGEMTEKYFNVITIENNAIKNVESVKLNTPQMVKIDCNYDEYLKIKERYENSGKIEGSKFNNLKLWIKVNCNTQNLNKEKEIKWWNEYDIDVRIDIESIKLETIKRETNYSSKMSLVDKFKLWCKSKNIKPTEFEIEKIKEYEE